jgi:catechol 2,3-dioxygenase-like lactoylglutathione lyase family enzyme/predicted SnoaL-like aldol condensation-catalyzing enzyme
MTERVPYHLRCSGVSELALLVQDLERAEAFYSGTLGLPTVERCKDAVWVMVGERTRIGLWLESVAPLAGERGGSHVHFALHVDEGALDPLVRHLEESGHAVHVEVFSDGRGRAAYVTDPDGHVVEFSTWNVAGHLGQEHENKELVRAYTRAVFDEGDVDAVDRYLAPDFYNHVTGRRGSDDFKKLASQVGGRTGSANVIDLLVGEGEYVVALMTITRTLHEELQAFGLTLPASGQSYTVKHVHIYRIAGGQILEHWAVRDDLSMLRQLDVEFSLGGDSRRPP